jgi:hypothetical protein
VDGEQKSGGRGAVYLYCVKAGAGATCGRSGGGDDVLVTQSDEVTARDCWRC